MSGARVHGGALIDRSRPLGCSFEGRRLTAYAGDTLASALLANGASVVGRSFKYHRPRGLLAAGVEEPNALMRVGRSEQIATNLRATEVELWDGLEAWPINCWPNARFDLGAVNNLFSRFIPAGFYYKTFMWPHWGLFEPFIRKAAGLGVAPDQPDPSRYETRHAHCDVLIVGAGPAGLSAALAADAGGKRVILVEQDPALGGSLLDEDKAFIDGRLSDDWLSEAKASLGAARDVRVLTRTTATGYFDHNCLSLLERVPREPTRPNLPSERLWIVRAQKVVLATGALERPLVFPGNDRPGVMLASAVRNYLSRFGVLAGQQVVIFTNNDSAYAAAVAIQEAGGKILAVVDIRAARPPEVTKRLAKLGAPLLEGARVVATRGRPSLTEVDILEATGRRRRIKADLLAMSGGWNPTAHLHCQSGGRLAWDEAIAAFRPGARAQAEVSVGAANGVFGLGAAMTEGARAGGGSEPATSGTASPWTIEPLWRVAAKGKAFVDFQNDVTVSDIELAARESFISVEHLKRYTTLGMAPDQGKTSNVNGLAVMAELTGRSIPETGTTRFRFPYTPTAFGALAGRARGELFRPYRRLPTHDRQHAAGAVLEEYGGWLRPAYYRRVGETPHAAEQREAMSVRTGVGLFDGSPLGKIEVVGTDAASFLDRLYANSMSTLKVGRARYGLMLNEVGVVIDDGVTTRLAEDRFLVGTTSGGAERISSWMDEWLQCEWPTLDVLIAPVTTAWAVLTLTGPQARAVLQSVGGDIDLSPAAFPHMAYREGRVAGHQARVLRASFTGEVSFEVSVAWDQAEDLWDRLAQAGAPFGMAPVGIDAWMLLRTEKGYLHVGTDTDGSTAPADIGWERTFRRRDEFIGRRSLTRPDNLRTDRHQLVGLEGLEPVALTPGGHVRGGALAAGSEGYVTSSGFSPILGRGVALGMLKGGSRRHGEVLTVVTGPDKGRRVRVTAPGAYDPQGERLNG
jgi:sarcosine oxidase subunit alpha